MHLMKGRHADLSLQTGFGGKGDNVVANGLPKYTEPTDEIAGRVYINPRQYFEGITPELWEFHIGGYQVLEKWLKDRRGRTLSFDDLIHYQSIVVALEVTDAITDEIDETIPSFPPPKGHHTGCLLPEKKRTRYILPYDLIGCSSHLTSLRLEVGTNFPNRFPTFYCYSLHISKID